jgi:small subunit ribosomal protein S9
MPVKKTVKKEKAAPVAQEKKEVKLKYFSSIGRRKAAIARVRLFDIAQKKEADEAIVINEKPMKQYLTLSDLQEIVEAPLQATGTGDKFILKIQVKGGGIRGQAEAIRLGVARALVKYKEDFRKTLRDLGYLTRDARVVERKKAGLRKARRAPQFSKR